MKNLLASKVLITHHALTSSLEIVQRVLKILNSRDGIIRLVHI